MSCIELLPKMQSKLMVCVPVTQPIKIAARFYTILSETISTQTSSNWASLNEAVEKLKVLTAEKVQQLTMDVKETTESLNKLAKDHGEGASSAIVRLFAFVYP
jgi:predicted phosphoribosyltransferase